MSRAAHNSMDSNNKLLMKNSFYNVLYQLLNITFPFITSIYVARVLMADSIGKVAAAQNIVQYFTILAAMGIPTYGIKLVAQFKIKSNDLDKAFSELFIINLCLTVVSSVCYYMIIFFVPYFEGKHLIYAVTGFTLILNVINVDWFYQGIQEYGYIAKRSFVVKCIFLVLLIFFVNDQNDYVIYALLNSLALVGNYLFNIVKLRRYVRLTILNLKFKTHLNHIFALFGASIAAEVYVLADTTMLDIMCESEIVGYYTMSMRIMRILRGLVVAVSAVFLPQLSNYYYSNEKEKFLFLTNKGLHILTVLSIPVAAGIILVADDAILTFFGSGYSQSILTTQVLAVSVISVALSNYIGMQILIILGKERITTLSTICGAVINITLNYFLIVHFQHFGAAIASAITEASVTIIQILLARKYVKFKFGLSNAAMAVSAMIIIVFGIHMIPIPRYTRLLMEIIGGILSYGFVLLALKDSFALSAKNLVINFIRKKDNNV